MPGQPKRPPPPRPGARIYIPHRRLTGSSQLAVGATINATEIGVHLVPTAGVTTFRCRAMVDVNDAILRVQICDPDGNPYTENQPNPETMVANTEAMIDVGLVGECYVEVSIEAPAGEPAVVTFVDVSATQF